MPKAPQGTERYGPKLTLKPKLHSADPLHPLLLLRSHDEYVVMTDTVITNMSL